MSDTFKQETQPWQVPTGYEGTNVPADFSIPSCGIEDVDKALFDFFDKVVGFSIVTEGKISKVPIIFAAGERFAMVRRKTPIRDKNGTLILPLISIRRTGFSQSDDVRGAPRNSGAMIIKKKLSSADRSYQRLINKADLENQDNTSSRSNFTDTDNTPPRGGVTGRIASRRSSGRSQASQFGPNLNANLGKNIFEVITMPFPQYFIAKYEIVIWSQFTQHMNQMIEQLMSSYDDQGTVQANVARLDTDKGYWFVATFDKEIVPDDNTADFSDADRIIRNTITVTVPGYIVAPVGPGMQNPFRKYLSAPTVHFESKAIVTNIKNDFQSPVTTSDTGKFVLEDVVIQNHRGEAQKRRGSTDIELLVYSTDPFTGKRTAKYVSTPNRNQRSGETVYRRALIEDLGDDVI